MQGWAARKAARLKWKPGGGLCGLSRRRGPGAQDVDKPDLLEVVGAQGAEVRILAVGGHQDVVQSGRVPHLHNDGVKAAGVTPVLLTGDHENAARTIARNLDIPVYRANCRPEDKLDWIDRSQQAGHPVCMVGDGINDAPALKKALVGIAMGGVGSDIAVDAADIALVNDDLRELPHLLRLSRRMMTTIKYNLTFSMALNFAAILLAITGILNSNVPQCFGPAA